MVLILAKHYNPRKGENHGRAKLTDQEVELLRRMVETKQLTQQQAAVKFEISEGHVSMLMNYLRR